MSLERRSITSRNHALTAALARVRQPPQPRDSEPRWRTIGPRPTVLPLPPRNATNRVAIIRLSIDCQLSLCAARSVLECTVPVSYSFDPQNKKPEIG